MYHSIFRARFKNPDSLFMAMDKPELMSPCADWTSLRAAVDAGCDAVYFGSKKLNMRAAAKNFELSGLKKVVDFCHERGVRAYLAVNTIIYERELDEMKKTLDSAKEAGIDSIICWDLSVLSAAKERGLKVTLSTQASVSNSDAAIRHVSRGVDRIVLARECTLDDIREMKEKAGCEIEVFVHGAMCVSVSGRCFMSQYLFGKSANRGECLQPCRRGYIVKDPEEGHELELGNSYVMSPKDLCTLPILDRIIDTGVDALKIEGRMRSPEYISVVTSAYRRAVDAYFEGKLDDSLKEELIKSCREVYNRGFSEGFYMGRPITEWTDEYGSKAEQKKVYIGKVRNYYQRIGVAEIRIESGNLKVSDRVMFQGPTTGILEMDVSSMQKSHEMITEASKGERIAIKTPEIVRVNDKVFIIKDSFK